MLPIFNQLAEALRAGYTVYEPIAVGYLVRRRNERGDGWDFAEVHVA